jgi:hypothetical protein
MFGPDPVSVEVRCFVLAHGGGVVLVDTGTPARSEAIGGALARVGAAWPDVTDIVLTHTACNHRTAGCFLMMVEVGIGERRNVSGTMDAHHTNMSNTARER